MKQKRAREQPQTEGRGMTKKEQARYRAIVRELSRLSRNGWDRATHGDYEPLEKELAALGDKLIKARALKP